MKGKRQLLFWSLILAAVIAAAHVYAFVMFRILEPLQTDKYGAYFQGKPGKLPEGPILEAIRREEREKLISREDNILNTYGWVDRPKGLIRTPLHWTIDFMLENEEFQTIEEPYQMGFRNHEYLP